MEEGACEIGCVSMLVRRDVRCGCFCFWWGHASTRIAWVPPYAWHDDDSLRDWDGLVSSDARGVAWRKQQRPARCSCSNVNVTNVTNDTSKNKNKP